MKKNNQGFSLVELMVVVAIIGVLASIAVPNINKYIAKARQSEAKTVLSSIYTSEKAFFAEYQAYHGMFGAIGFSPEGKIRYNAGFAGAGTEAGASNGYNANVTAPGNVRSTAAYCGANGVMANGCALLVGANGQAAPALPGNVTSATGTFGAVETNGSASFVAAAIAVVMGTAQDIWAINNNKDLQNTTPGIN